MPNSHAPDKETVSIWIPRSLAVSLKKKAKEQGQTLSDFLVDLYTQATADIELSSAEHHAIDKATRAAAQTGRRITTRIEPPKKNRAETPPRRRKK